MKKVLAFITTIIASIGARLTGHSIWILSLANFAWLLFKDAPLFSWWWVGYAAIAFILFVTTAFASSFLFVALDD